MTCLTRVYLHAVVREVLPIARILEPAVRHLGDERDVGVDPHRPEFEVTREPKGAGMVLRPDAGCQTVFDAVRLRQRVLLVDEGLHGDDRPEDLLLNRFIRLLQAGDHRGLKEIPCPIHSPAAGFHLRMPGKSVHESLDALQLLGVVEGP